MKWSWYVHVLVVNCRHNDLDENNCMLARGSKNFYFVASPENVAIPCDKIIKISILCLYLTERNRISTKFFFRDNSCLVKQTGSFKNCLSKNWNCAKCVHSLWLSCLPFTFWCFWTFSSLLFLFFQFVPD